MAQNVTNVHKDHHWPHCIPSQRLQKLEVQKVMLRVLFHYPFPPKHPSTYNHQITPLPMSFGDISPIKHTNFSFFSSLIDFDECNVYGTCSQTCTNTHGSYTCSCVEGYLLQPDHKSCKAKNGKIFLICSLVLLQAACTWFPLTKHYFSSHCIF